MRHVFDELNKGKAAVVAVINEACTADFVFHSSRGEEIRGLKDFIRHNTDFFNAVPDAHFTVDDMIAEGDKVATRWTATGTHTGEIGGIPATGEKFTFWGITIDHIVSGKCAEEWERYDSLGLMQQLGLIPTRKNKR